MVKYADLKKMFEKSDIELKLCNEEIILKLNKKKSEFKDFEIIGYKEYMNNGILEGIQIKVCYPQKEGNLFSIQYKEEIKTGNKFIDYFSPKKREWYCCIKPIANEKINIGEEKININLNCNIMEKNNLKSRMKNFLEQIGFKNVIIGPDDMKNMEQKVLLKEV